MRLTFGKYKNCELEQVPEEYLLWVLDNCDSLSPSVRSAIEYHLRHSLRPRGEPVATGRELQEWLANWYRATRRDYAASGDVALRVLDNCYQRLQGSLAILLQQMFDPGWAWGVRDLDRHRL